MRSDGQLYDYVQALKDRHMRKSVPLGKVIYDSKLQVMKLRGVSYQAGFHDFNIIRGGLEVYPRLVAALHRREYPLENWSSGSAELDQLLQDLDVTQS